MINIPVWVFILLVVFAAIGLLITLLIVVSLSIVAFTPVDEPKSNNCPEEIEIDDPNYNPEYIPLEREKPSNE